MSNGEVCCILGICCPPAEARVKLVSELQKASGYDQDGCQKIADFLEERFVFAPKSFGPVIEEIVRMAKHSQEKA